MKKILLSLMIGCMAILHLACVKPDITDADKQTIQGQPVDCDTCQYPVVMIHGFLASGDTWTRFHQLFTSNGYKPEWLHAFDWNSLAQGANNTTALDAFIDKVLTKTGADKVRLMGHSAGGGVAYTYLNDATRAAKVDGYVHIGSSVQSGPAGPGGTEPTLNLWSTADAVVSGGDITGATNVMIEGKDHYQIATSNESFAAVWQFFHGEAPVYTDIVPQGPLVCIAGKALFFGENKPLLNAKVEIYELDSQTGARVNAVPVETFFTDSLGFWGPINVKNQTNFEFVVTPPTQGQRVVHYFREPFKRLNSLVYLRTIPPPPSLAAVLLGGLPNTASQTVVNVFLASQGTLFGRDTLTASGHLLSTAQFAPASKTAITYFLYDDGDNQTELSPVGLFGSFPFLNGVDVYFPTAQPGTIPLILNDRTLNLRNIPSNQGIVVGVFD